MKNLIKKHSKIVLFVGVLLFSCEVFSASEATKKLIHDTLAKYCIPNDKTICNTPYEGKYDSNYNFCLCEYDGMVYSKSERKCKECNSGTHYRKDMKDNTCKICPAGTFSKRGSAFCINCPKGKFQDERGQSECKTCNSDACYEVRNNRTRCEFRCGDGRPYCDGSGSCVECTNDNHCTGRRTCSNGNCVCNINCSCGVNYSDCSCKAPDTCGSNEERDGNCGCRKKRRASGGRSVGCYKDSFSCNEEHGLVCNRTRCHVCPDC